jgi:hypothetical protein
LQKTTPARRILAKHRSKSSFSTGIFLLETAKIGKTVGFWLSHRLIYRYPPHANTLTPTYSRLPARQATPISALFLIYVKNHPLSQHAATLAFH